MRQPFTFQVDNLSLLNNKNLDLLKKGMTHSTLLPHFYGHKITIL